MARSTRVLALDIGAASVKAAEFEYAGGGTVILAGFDYREYGRDLTEETRSVAIATALRDILATNSFSARRALVCISGQFALTRFVKLPPVAEEENRVRQIVEFEARQNVPFPMEEVIWDYQLIANPEAEELEVMFVVIKNEIVEQITNAVQAVGLAPILVDVAPCACYNAARANYVGDSECAMILNLGDRSTNLLFADRAQFFTRTIPIAGHSITQQIAKEFGIGMSEAEELKRRHGFVALGGAYAEPESEVAGAVSKIVRNVMTRLHGEINRSIGVYRAQQHGNVPKRLFLTGGSSIMGYTDKFFSEKLGIPVEYLNPFQVVQLAAGIDADRLQDMAHMFSEVIGLGLRYCVQSPVEVSLMPEAITRQIALRQKKPYLVACVACVLVMLVIYFMATLRREQQYGTQYETTVGLKKELESLQKRIVVKEGESKKLLERYESVATLLERRQRWPQILSEIEALLPENVWLVELEPVTEQGATIGGSAAMGSAMDMPLPFLGGPFGGMGPAGGPRGGTAKRADEGAQLKAETLHGLTLRGHSVVVAMVLDEFPERGPAAAGDEPSAEDGPAAPFLPGPEDAAGTDEESDGGEPRMLTPEQLFVRRLAHSGLFDPEQTVITSYTSDESVMNLKTFTIRIVLTEPLELSYD